MCGAAQSNWRGDQEDVLAVSGLQVSESEGWMDYKIINARSKEELRGREEGI